MINLFFRMVNKIDFYVRLWFCAVTISHADIVLMGTSAQNNLGDHAISVTELDWLRSSIPNKRVVEIPKELFYKKRDFWKLKIRKEATIVITGGGFLGDLWMTEERMVRAIICDYKDNKIVIMPQTIFFESEIEKAVTAKVYRSAAELYINTRDKKSYEYIKHEWPDINVFLAPDMVLSLSARLSDRRRKNDVLLCLREDKENCLDEKEIAFIKKSIIEMGLNVCNISTVEKHIVPIFLRKNAIEAKLKKFSSAKLVVTNRLHAMIFSYITKTPCIAIDNISNKVSGVYAWIEGVPHIKLVKDIDEITGLMKVLLESREEVNTIDLKNYYSCILEQIK